MSIRFYDDVVKSELDFNEIKMQNHRELLPPAVDALPRGRCCKNNIFLLICLLALTSTALSASLWHTRRNTSNWHHYARIPALRFCGCIYVTTFVLAIEPQSKGGRLSPSDIICWKGLNNPNYFERSASVIVKDALGHSC